MARFGVDVEADVHVLSRQVDDEVGVVVHCGGEGRNTESRCRRKPVYDQETFLTDEHGLKARLSALLGTLLSLSGVWGGHDDPGGR